MGIILLALIIWCIHPTTDTLWATMTVALFINLMPGPQWSDGALKVRLYA